MIVLFTNNTAFSGIQTSGQPDFKNTVSPVNLKNLKFINSSSLDVLVAVRNSVHLGSRILTHPLCGNLRPAQQPYRSVLVDEHNGPVDLQSLSLIEEAISLYQASPFIALPENYQEAVRYDYSVIDFELMRASIEQYRI